MVGDLGDPTGYGLVRTGLEAEGLSAKLEGQMSFLLMSVDCSGSSFTGMNSLLKLLLSRLHSSSALKLLSTSSRS